MVNNFAVTAELIGMALVVLLFIVGVIAHKLGRKPVLARRDSGRRVLSFGTATSPTVDAGLPARRLHDRRVRVRGQPSPRRPRNLKSLCSRDVAGSPGLGCTRFPVPARGHGRGQRSDWVLAEFLWYPDRRRHP